jgi:DNA-binding CsgD family transcriptional regulator
MEQPDGLTREILQLTRQNLSIVEFVEKAKQAMQQRVAFDSYGMVLFDPATMLPTQKMVDPSIPPEMVMESLSRTLNEGGCLDDSIGQWPLASRLSNGAHSALERNTRYRQGLQPYGMGDEVRMRLAVDGRTWGALKMQRHAGEPDFEDADVALLAQASPALAMGLRRTFLSRPVSVSKQLDSPAVIVLSSDDRVVSCTDTARELLAAMAGGVGLGPDRLPIVVHVMAWYARRPNGAPARARLRMHDGHWITVRAATLDGGERVALVMESSRPSEVAALLLDAYGLTQRESQIARHVIRAFSTEDVADALGISPYTVQDHLKSIFDKMGLSSRRELAARVYLAH